MITLVNVDPTTLGEDNFAFSTASSIVDTGISAFEFAPVLNNTTDIDLLADLEAFQAATGEAAAAALASTEVVSGFELLSYFDEDGNLALNDTGFDFS